MPLFFATNHQEFLARSTNCHDDMVGGAVSFVGTVRAHNHGKAVSYLEYEADETLAKSMFLDLEQTARTRFHLIDSLACHRLARVEVGMPAVVIQALARHRDEAFLGARFLIDELKRTVPIWKKEVYSDGNSSWDQSHCCAHENDKAIFAPPARALLVQKITHEVLAQKHVIIIGAGGLGCPLAVNLCALGLRLTIIDGDRVALSNLARQYAYRIVDQGRSKAQLLCNFLEDRFGARNIAAVDSFVDEKNFAEMGALADLIIDATDHRATKVLLKRMAFRYKWPLISASVHQQDGEVQVFTPHGDGCALCFDKAISMEFDNCAQLGVLTHVCQMVAAVASDRAMRVLSGTDKARNELTIVDPACGVRVLAMSRDPHCSTCGNEPLRKPLVSIVRHTS